MEMWSEIEINKTGFGISISEYWTEDSPFRKHHISGKMVRKNSAMTKDLIKLEMMCRVYSFRPTENQCIINQLRRKYDIGTNTLLSYYPSAEKNDI